MLFFKENKFFIEFHKDINYSKRFYFKSTFKMISQGLRVSDQLTFTSCKTNRSYSLPNLFHFYLLSSLAERRAVRASRAAQHLLQPVQGRHLRFTFLKAFFSSKKTRLTLDSSSPVTEMLTFPSSRLKDISLRSNFIKVLKHHKVQSFSRLFSNISTLFSHLLVIVKPPQRLIVLNELRHIEANDRNQTSLIEGSRPFSRPHKVQILIHSQKEKRDQIRASSETLSLSTSIVFPLHVILWSYWKAGRDCCG